MKNRQLNGGSCAINHSKLATYNGKLRLLKLKLAQYFFIKKKRLLNEQQSLQKVFFY